MSKDVYKAGWIKKQGNNARTWKERYLVTENNGLAYYKKENKKDRQGFIELVEAIVVIDTNHKRINVFQIITPTRTWFISCDSSHERESWINVIKAMIKSVDPKAERSSSSAPTRPQAFSVSGELAKGAGFAAQGLRELKTSLNQTLRENPVAMAPSAIKNVSTAAVSSARKVKNTVKKKKAFFVGAEPIGKLYVQVLEAKFNGEADPTARPFISSYFERQQIDSAPSKRGDNPKWKESFLYDVINMESNIKIRMFNGVKSEDTEMGLAKISIKLLEDEKQRKQWYDFTGKVPGQFLINWRFEKIVSKNEDRSNDKEVLGTIQLTVTGARNLKERPTGALRHSFVQLIYGDQDYKTDVVPNSCEPEYNFGVIFRVITPLPQECTIRVVDTEKVSRTHLGTIKLSTQKLLESRLSEPSTEQWLYLQLEQEDDRADNQVGGELFVKYKYQKLGDIFSKKTYIKSDQTIDINPSNDKIPECFPPAPVADPFSGNKEEYRRKKAEKDRWIKALAEYKIKEAEGDVEGMEKIINQLKNSEQDTNISDESSEKSDAGYTINTLEDSLDSELAKLNVDLVVSQYPSFDDNIEVSQINEETNHNQLEDRFLNVDGQIGLFSLDTAVIEQNHDVLYKIIIIGNSGVGKTNILGRWMDNKFHASSATINVEFAAKSFIVDEKIVKVQLWDTAGQEQYRAITRSYYRQAHGAIVVYDITNYSSFDRIPTWIQDVKEADGNENTQIMLVGNKSDLDESREVSTEDAIEFSKQHGLNFLETSALNGNNINRAFQIILQEIHIFNEKMEELHGKKSIQPAKTVKLFEEENNQETKSDSCCAFGSETEPKTTEGQSNTSPLSWSLKNIFSSDT